MTNNRLELEKAILVDIQEFLKFFERPVSFRVLADLYEEKGIERLQMQEAVQLGIDNGLLQFGDNFKLVLGDK
jgi:predicted GNAT family N-acyltransferase